MQPYSAGPAWEYRRGEEGQQQPAAQLPTATHKHSWAQRVGRLAQAVCGGRSSEEGLVLPKTSSPSWRYVHGREAAGGRAVGRHSPTHGYPNPQAQAPSMDDQGGERGRASVNPWGQQEAVMTQGSAEEPSPYDGLSRTQVFFAVLMPLVIRLAILLVLASLLLPWWLWTLPDPQASAGKDVAWVGGGVWLWEARSCVGKAGNGPGVVTAGIYCFAIPTPFMPLAADFLRTAGGSAGTLLLASFLCLLACDDRDWAAVLRRATAEGRGGSVRSLVAGEGEEKLPRRACCCGGMQASAPLVLASLFAASAALSWWALALVTGVHGSGGLEGGITAVTQGVAGWTALGPGIWTAVACACVCGTAACTLLVLTRPSRGRGQQQGGGDTQPHPVVWAGASAGSGHAYEQWASPTAAGGGSRCIRAGETGPQQ